MHIRAKSVVELLYVRREDAEIWLHPERVNVDLNVLVTHCNDQCSCCHIGAGDKPGVDKPF